MLELWKPVAGFEGEYEVSSKGRVKSLDRTVLNSLGRKYNIKGCIRKNVLHNTGYEVVRLGNNTFRVHRLVACAFLQNPDNKPFVNHKDGDKRNNKLENLEWATEQENTDHAIQNELFNVKGVNNPACKFTEADVSDWWLLYSNGIELQQIADEYGTNRNSISRLLRMYYIVPKYKGYHPFRGQ